jgi:RimJ/RimL family protein N-acetyltransferase
VEIALARCTLREWRADDARSLVLRANNPAVSRNLAEIFPYPYTANDADKWLTRFVGVSPQTQFAIVVDGTAVGGIGVFLGSDIHRRSAEIGYWLAEEHWGKGIMTEAVRAVTRYAFSTFDVAHVFAGLFARNDGSRRVLEKAGFVFEGRLRQHVTKGGETMDDLIYGIVREEI